MYREYRNHHMLVLASWKGVPVDTILVRTQISSSCGFHFDRDTVYLVYADRKEDGRLWSWIGSRSGILDQRPGDLALLGKPKVRSPGFTFEAIGLDDLLLAARSDEGTARWSAIGGLADWKARQPEIDRVLADWLATGDQPRIMAALEVCALKGKEANIHEYSIERRLRDSRPDIRGQALETFSHIASPGSAWSALLAGLQDTDPLVRRSASISARNLRGHCSGNQIRVLLESLVDAWILDPDHIHLYSDFSYFGKEACPVLPKLRSMAGTIDSERGRRQLENIIQLVTTQCLDLKPRKY